MQLLPGTETLFLNIFDHIKDEIRSQKGCLGLELLRAQATETNFWTISLWQSVDDLETYRSSPLFRKTWSEVKPFFSAKAQAWTLTSVVEMT